jgi:hypothetical protein
MTTPAEVSDIHARLASRYHITRLLGRGGMGAVHLARDVQLDRLVAIKELPPEFASDPTLRERFLREVRMAASFSHPNIVPVYAIEEQGDALAFVMGYVEGESLADRVKRAGAARAARAGAPAARCCVCARVRTRTRRGASRHQTRQHHDRARDWPRFADGFWRGAIDRVRANGPAPA